MLAGARAVAAKHLTLFLRSPMEVTLTLFSPVLWLVLFGIALDSVLAGRLPGAQADYLPFLAVGLVALTAMTASLFAGATVYLEIDRGEVKQYLAAPIGRYEYGLGLGLSSAVKTLAQSAIILVLAVPLGLALAGLAGALVAVVVVAAFAVGAFGLSTWLATKSPSFEAFHGLLILLNLPLLFLSDALYPLEGLPLWMKAVAAANPLTHLVELLRVLLLGEVSPLGTGINVAVLAGFVLLGTWLGARAVGRLEA